MAAKSNAPGARKPQRKRLAPEQREAMIVQEAIKYFGEFGFNAPTRELARRVGITQPLLYRYFPTKEKLVERLFEELVSEQWDPNWERRLVNRETPIADRLTAFYISYTASLFTYERMRAFVFMWLSDNGLRQQFIGSPSARLFRQIAEELRVAFELPGPASVPITKMEEELVWGLQGSVMYLGIREFVYGLAPRVGRKRLIRAEVDVFLRGVEPELRKAMAEAAPKKAVSTRP
jgi:AcrR family transcriptional regulator